jgi:UDP:flavonoid glycosyltransferase YjiC (YdhE family)
MNTTTTKLTATWERAVAAIVMTSIANHGHITPMLTIARHFADRGDEVRFITGESFADQVSATGARFVPMPPEADLFGQDPFAKYPERSKLKGVKAVAFDLENVIIRPAKAQYEALTTTLAAQPADAVLSEPLFVGAAFMLGHPRPTRPAIAMCSVIPLPIDSRDTAPFGMGLAPAPLFNRQRNAALATVNRLVLRRARQLLDDLYRQVHGTNFPGEPADWGRRADAIAQFGVRSFEYPRSDAPEHLFYTGPLSAAGSYAPLPDWWGDLDGSRPVVHVTQGTVANIDYNQAIAPTLRALAAEDVLVVVATGGRPLETLPILPGNARAALYLPYDELLPRTSVFVTNGGYGGVQYALRHGVPIVATGGKEDKPEVGARIAWTGVGRRIRSEHPSPRELRRDILAVLREPSYREASRRIAADIAEAPGFAGLAEVVDRLVAVSPDRRPTVT